MKPDNTVDPKVPPQQTRTLIARRAFVQGAAVALGGTFLLLGFPGAKTLGLYARWVRSRFSSSLLILGYHRIAETDWDPHSLCVSPRHFAEQLDVISAQAHPLGLGEALERLSSGTLPKGAVVLTLDDGYADNLYNAKPLLERYGCPATVFVATGAPGRRFWWDELTEMLDPSRTLPNTMVVRIDGQSHEWDLGEAAQAARNDEDRRSREQLLYSVSDLLRPLSEPIRRNAMEQLRLWAGEADEGTSTARALTPDEVVELAAGELIEVGAHTVTHPMLPTLSEPEQQYELSQSKRSLQELLGKQITSFSYPNGLFNAKIVEFVRQTGFVYACTSYRDVALPDTDRFLLPRFWVQDQDGAAFSQLLRLWLNG